MLTPLTGSPRTGGSEIHQWLIQTIPYMCCFLAESSIIRAMSNEPDSPSESIEPTYLVIGADGSTYGPVDLPTLKLWAADGRILASTMLINQQTQVRLQARYIQGLISETAESDPPSASGATYDAPVERKKTSTWLVAGIVVVGGCCGCGVIGAAILFPVFSQAKQAAKKTMALSNLKQAAAGIMIYGGDWDDKFPLRMDTGSSIEQAIGDYTKNPQLFVSVNEAGGEILGNPRLSGKSMAKVVNPSRTVMIYDSKPWPRDVAVVAYADTGASSTQPFSTVMSELQVDPFKP